MHYFSQILIDSVNTFFRFPCTGNACLSYMFLFPNPHHHPPTSWDALPTSHTVTVYHSGFPLSPSSFPLQPPSAGTLLPLPINSALLFFQHILCTYPLFLLCTVMKPLSHFPPHYPTPFIPPPSIISSHPSLSSHLFQINLLAMVQGFKGEARSKRSF